MSHHHTSRELHDAATDHRNEIAQVKRLTEHEAEVRRVFNDRHERRFQPLLPSSNRESDDFEGATE